MISPSEFSKAQAAIFHINDEQELHQLNKNVIERIKMLRAAKSKAVKASLTEGAKVTWVGRRGAQSGVVVSIKRKFAHIDSGSSTWRVPMNMLTVVK